MKVYIDCKNDLPVGVQVDTIADLLKAMETVGIKNIEVEIK